MKYHLKLFCSKMIALHIFLFCSIASVFAASNFEDDKIALEYAQYGACCVDQDPPKVSVVKLMIDSRTRSVTKLQKVAGKCGIFGWDICTKYTTRVEPQTYYVQLYTHKSTFPPCKRYSCCDGFQQLIDKCLHTHDLSRVVSLLADWRDKNRGSTDLRGALSKILKDNKILG